MKEYTLDEISDGEIIIDTDGNYKWSGKTGSSAILDKLLETMNSNIKIQFDSGRIDGPDFAKAYVEMYTATIQTAVSLLSSDRQIYLSKMPSALK